MSQPEYLTNEATTEFAASRTLEETPAVASWLETLDPADQRRFREFAHHIYHTAFEDGLSRPRGDITPVQRQEIIGHQFGIYLCGVDDTTKEHKMSEGER